MVCITIATVIASPMGALQESQSMCMNGEMLYTLRKDHNEPARRLIDVNSGMFVSELKGAPRRDPAKSARQMQDQMMSDTLNRYSPNCHDEIISSVTDFVRCRNSVQRTRRENRPALPSTLADTVIDGQWAETIDGQ